MMKKQFRKPIAWILSLIALFTFFIMPVHADTGPKPSLRIQCAGFGENAYVTVFATVSQYGPNQVKSASEYQAEGEEYFQMRGVEKEVYLAFCEEAERLAAQGEELYFWGVVTKCENEYVFGYWPPEEFRVCVYLKDTGEFILSDEIYDRKAFNTIYQCTYVNGGMMLRNISSAAMSLGGVVRRVLITILIEYLIGMFFMKYTSRAVWTLISANTATQMFLNVTAALAAYHLGTGTYTYTGVILIAEAVIIIAEWLIYRKWIGKDQLASPLLYSAAANCASYVSGLLIAGVMPSFLA